MRAGETQKVMLEFTNAGRYLWRGTGRHYVSLYATGPYGRKSVFRAPDWNTTKQVERIPVDILKPGKSAAIEFTLKAPEKPGTYVEQFQLAVENIAWIYGSVVRMKIVVQPSDAPPSQPIVSAKSWIVVDADTGDELAAHDPDAVRSIASITKLMSTLVVEAAGVDPEKVMSIEREDEVGGGRLRVNVGSLVSVRDLMASALIGSANNAANTMARATGLPREEFVRRMNAQALDFGMASTSFADPTGIMPSNVSTARDVARMSLKAFKDPIILSMAGTPKYQVAAVTNRTYIHEISNTNKLIKDPDLEVVAGKTGFLYESLYTLTTRLRKPGERDLVVVVLGSDRQDLSFKEAKALAEWTWKRL